MTRRESFVALILGAGAVMELLMPPDLSVPAPQVGISLRYIRHYDIAADTWPRRDLYFHRDAFSMVMAPLQTGDDDGR